MRRRFGRGQAEEERAAVEQAEEERAKADAADLITNPWDFYPEVQTLRQAAKATDWPTVRTMLAELEYPEDRAAVGELLRAAQGVEEMLTAAVAKDPEDTTALALLGGRTIVLGWQIRGGGRASTVSEAHFEAFHDHVERAEAMLLEVVARDPANIDAGIARITAARALSMGSNEVERRYRQLAVHHPHLWSAQRQALQGLLPKWGGTWEAARSFAVECAGAAPPGSPNPALIADYHYEKWLDLPADDNWDYIRGYAARKEILAAAEASVLSPDYRPGLSWVEAHNDFAKVLCFADEFKSAAVLFDRLEGRMTGWGSATTFVRYRHLAATWSDDA